MFPVFQFVADITPDPLVDEYEGVPVKYSMEGPSAPDRRSSLGSDPDRDGQPGFSGCEGGKVREKAVQVFWIYQGKERDSAPFIRGQGKKRRKNPVCKDNGTIREDSDHHLVHRLNDGPVLEGNSFQVLSCTNLGGYVV